MRRGHITEMAYGKELAKIVRMSGADRRNMALGELNRKYFATRPLLNMAIRVPRVAVGLFLLVTWALSPVVPF